jgi:hypothetical protein
MIHGWIPVTNPLTQELAEAAWHSLTCSGTLNSKYEDGNYFKIFIHSTTDTIQD